MKKTLITILATVLVCACVAGGTIAWLVDQTDPITNTFTVGDINITLKETTTTYKMVPGTDIPKDPKVTVKGGSEACYLFVKLEKSANFDTYMTYAMATGWTALTGNDGVYYREVTSSATDQEFVVLDGNKVTVEDDITKADLASAKDSQPTLTFTAYAVQKANVADAATAWGYATAAANNS